MAGTLSRPAGRAQICAQKLASLVTRLLDHGVRLEVLLKFQCTALDTPPLPPPGSPGIDASLTGHAILVADSSSLAQPDLQENFPGCRRRTMLVVLHTHPGQCCFLCEELGSLRNSRLPRLVPGKGDTQDIFLRSR